MPPENPKLKEYLHKYNLTREYLRYLYHTKIKLKMNTKVA
jgi:hypothetical protein